MVVQKCLPVSVFIIMYILCVFLTCSIFCTVTAKKGEEKKVDKKKKRKDGRKKRWEGGKEKERSEEGRK